MKESISYSVFFGKKILLGVSGSIAAYKIPELVRMFKKKGAEVKVLLTQDASAFVSPLTLSTLSENDVIIDFINESGNQWNNHVELSLWADAFLIAPATANTMAKLASGLCDNILLATFLSCTCPVFCAPAMDRDMYLNRATVKNLQILKKRGINILEVESGELASGLHGLGRMRDVQKMFNEIEVFFSNSLPLFGTKVLVTAGPTYEQIDPVRFIGNFSSGKMGIELAKCAASQGAIVDLVIGPSSETCEHPLVTRYDVQTADDMFLLCKEKFKKSDIAIFSAAVSDFKPIKVSNQKIKRKSISIKTQKNIDILKTLAKTKKNQFIVGFALETCDENHNAIKKMKNKDMDLIVLNSLNNKDSCFGYDTNKIQIIDKNLNILDYPLMPKKEVASIIFDEILLKQKSLSSFKNILT
ncbi:MAG: bifunctional phosphopantothenoylcysteine decarboxylase/phosphopantothenate--cysteine ligase CoaBC [Flavobacteriales bacterium]|nr:bifunctional phosphopantothenoylcysteine decarboxylase/phosphopantothenate--cysteine ligase CoaBC [Flavobacteriales bacterium]